MFPTEGIWDVEDLNKYKQDAMCHGFQDETSTSWPTPAVYDLEKLNINRLKENTWTI